MVTSSLLSWRVPSYIPDNYSITQYQLGYYATSDCNTDYYHTDNVSSVNVTSSDTLEYNIIGLLSDTCYVFIIRAYTNNGFGPWISITDKTMENTNTTTNTDTTNTDTTNTGM